ncbi:MAG: hypothetical protein U0T84_08360 [Chitinophagales bacterium]
MLDEELNRAIQNLYDTFSSYPFRSVMEGCPCCISGAEKEKIHTKPLRDLNEDDLSTYAYKAMTTWGDTDDFKHYLPRIFELLSTTNFMVDTFVVLGKLDYGKWKEWPQKEQVAIINFLWAWWKNALSTKSYFDKELLVELYQLTGNVESLLSRWTISLNDNSFSNFVDLIYQYYIDLTGKQNKFKEMDQASIEKLIAWIKRNATDLTEGFFYFADKDTELAEKISEALYIIEHH